MIKPILASIPILYPPGSTGKPNVFWYFRGLLNRSIGLKSVSQVNMLVYGLCISLKHSGNQNTHITEAYLGLYLISMVKLLQKNSIIDA